MIMVLPDVDKRSHTAPPASLQAALCLPSVSNSVPQFKEKALPLVAGGHASVISRPAGTMPPRPQGWGTEGKNLSESASLFSAAERSAGIIQIVQLDLHRRDGPLQVFVLVLFSGDLVGVGGVILGGGFLVGRNTVIPIFDPPGGHHMAQCLRLLCPPAAGRMGAGPPHLQDEKDHRDRQTDDGAGLVYGCPELPEQRDDLFHGLSASLLPLIWKQIYTNLALNRRKVSPPSPFGTDS